MLTSELPEFESLVKRLERIFGRELDEQTLRDYWDALRDQSLSQVQRLVAHHIKNGKFFPKPSELRPREERGVMRDAKTEADFREGEQRAIRNLAGAERREVALRRLDRLIAITHESEPAYARVRCEWMVARGLDVGAEEFRAAGM